MKNFQKIPAQIARENGTTPEEVLFEMQAAINAAYASPSAKEKYVQNAIPSQGGRSTVTAWLLSQSICDKIFLKSLETGGQPQ